MKEVALSVRTAANNFAVFETSSCLRYVWCALVLVLRHGFLPWGRYVPPLTDQAIYPTLRRRRVLLLAGWDINSGYHFLANSPEADGFLRAFAARRGAASPDASHAALGMR